MSQVTLLENWARREAVAVPSRALASNPLCPVGGGGGYPAQAPEVETWCSPERPPGRIWEATPEA